MSMLTSMAPTEAIQRGDTPERGPAAQSQAPLCVYVMDLWSFIPYYMARLCASLREQGIDARLGSVRYHLERNYFRSVGIRPDLWLFDNGGIIRNSLLRRIVKSIEYVLNLCLLGLRFVKSAPAILHVQYLRFLDRGFPFEIWFLKWARHLGVRIVYTVHNVTYPDAPDRHKPLYGRAYRMADALICHGTDARARLIQDFGIPAERIWVIPHGPLFDERPTVSPREARAKLALPESETLVLSAGVISEYKGVPFLLDAWKRLIESGVKGRLLIAGTGDPRLLSSIREKVLANGMESSVDLWLHFIPVDQLPLIYQAADILVYPYEAGTTSGAFLTGMNYGKAIVGTPLPYFLEHLTHGQEALFVDYGDVDGLARTLAQLIDDPGQRDQLGRAVTSHTETHESWNSIASATIECYEAILRTASARTIEPPK
jgi:glycosyltransferase involved in cell wall biosynthesis